MRKPTLIVLLFAAAMISMISGPSIAQPVDELVTRIIEVRGQVDDMDAELSQAKAAHAARMAALGRELGQLTAERERQMLRLQRIERDLETEQRALAAAGGGSDALVPIIDNALTEVGEYVAASLPFQRVERLQALDEMRSQLHGGALDPARISNRLWSFIADEIRLAGEVGLYRQAVDVRGEPRLAEVARVGMMQLYYETDDGALGHAVRDGDDWRFIDASGADRDRIRALLNSLRKKVRSGYFELPIGANQ